MDNKRLDLLIEWSNKFYSGEPTGVSDEIYDQYRKEAEDEGINIFKLLSFNDEATFKHDSISELNKETVKGNLVERVIQHLDQLYSRDALYYCNFKYDGSSIVIYYKNGYLEKILSNPDSLEGIDKTKSYCNLVPTKVHPSIRSIQCEVVVDLKFGFGQNSRGKANGLVNSKHMKDEVERLASLRAYRVNEVGVTQFDFYKNDALLQGLPTLTDESGRVYFSRSEKLLVDQLPNNDVGTAENGMYQVDGVVVYSTEGVKGFKFYYTESAVSVIKAINWNLTGNESYANTAVIDPVIINGKRVSGPTFSGVDMMIDNRRGIGSQVRVILSGVTIPKIVDTIIPSDEFTFPTCSCGTKLNQHESKFGSTLKCHNKDCKLKIDFRINRLKNWFSNSHEALTKVGFWEKFSKNPINNIGNLLNIDRFDPMKKYVGIHTLESLTEKVRSLIENRDAKGFEELVLSIFSYSDLQRSLFNLNVQSTYVALYIYYNALPEVE